MITKRILSTSSKNADKLWEILILKFDEIIYASLLIGFCKIYLAVYRSYKAINISR